MGSFREDGKNLSPSRQTLRVSRFVVGGILLLCIYGVVYWGFFRSNIKIHAAVPAFYFWKTRFELTQEERLYLSNMKCNKLYVKFFDVDWDQSISSTEAIPKGSLEFPDSTFDTLSNRSRLESIDEVIPTIFLTNRTFDHISSNLKETDSLAAKVASKISSMFHRGFPTMVIREIQLDCDWTLHSREAYFTFLRSLRKNLLEPNVRLSATIRLHQIKYKDRVGIPPVDRGMLMYYNMGSIDDVGEVNSIFDETKAKAFLPYLQSYSLPLDIALPVFGWGVIMRRNQLVGLLDDATLKDFDDTNHFSRIGTNMMEVKKSTYFDYSYLYQGDHIRLESVSVADLKRAVDELSRSFPETDKLTIAFFHLNKKIIGRYPYEDLLSLSRNFK